MKKRIAILSIPIVFLIILLLYSMVIISEPKDSEVSLGIDQGTVDITDTFVYWNNSDMIYKDGTFISSWQDNEQIVIQSIDEVTAEFGDIIPIANTLTNPKKIRFKATENELKVYIQEGIILNCYNLNNITGELDNKVTLHNDIKNFEYLPQQDLLIYYSNKSELKVFDHNLTLLFEDKLKLFDQRVYDGETAAGFLFKYRQDNKYFIKGLKFSTGNVETIYYTDDLGNTSKKLSSIFIDDSNVSVVLKESSVGRDYTFYRVFLSEDNGRTYTEYLHDKYPYLSSEFQVIGIDGDTYRSEEVHRGDVYHFTYENGKRTTSEMLAYTRSLAKDVRVLNVNGETFVRWHEKSGGSANKYCFASSSQVFIDKGMEETAVSLNAVLFSGFLMLIMSIIPAAIVLCYLAFGLFPTFFILKGVLRYDFDFKKSFVAKVMVGVYLLMMLFYFVFYMQNHYQNNVLVNVVHPLIFLSGGIMLVILAGVMVYWLFKKDEDSSPFLLSSWFVGVATCYVIIYTVPNVLAVLLDSFSSLFY